MSAELIDAFDGIATVEVTGKLSPDELAEVHRQTAVPLAEWGGGCLLVLADRFQGWTEDDKWASINFQTANELLVHKMAMVADVRWEVLAMMFTARGSRPFPIEYFSTGQEAEARCWLKA
ncbi:STAS/SEC14 domain-containing protein [Luteolibacter soli]|uniref:STAS/SEC14 domain-containing protein n=1 Tax=Luteolibacter soli TaxID=3135280 RepID=A0ABU9ANQ1_9BACT